MPTYLSLWETFISLYSFKLLCTVHLFLPERLPLTFLRSSGNEFPQPLFIGKCVYFSLIWRERLAEYRNHSWQFFSILIPSNISSHTFSFWLPIFLLKNSTHNLIRGPLYMVNHFSFAALKFYSLCYYSCTNFSPFAALYPVPPIPSSIPPLVHIHGLCI